MNALIVDYLPIVVFIGVAAVIGLALLISPFLWLTGLRTSKSCPPMNAGSIPSTTPA